MATLDELKTRIATEMVRDDLLDDLADQLTLHIARAIEYFSDEEFWFNVIVTTGVTVASTVGMNIPATVRRIDRVTIPAQYVELRECSLPEIEGMDNAMTGRPSWYCYYNDQIRFWPIPDAVYTLQFTGLKQIDAPTADDDDDTVWTNQAQDLICARARMTLYRDQFRDAEGAGLARAATDEALSRLKQETARRLETPLRGPAHYGRSGFNIYSGDSR